MGDYGAEFINVEEELRLLGLLSDDDDVLPALRSMFDRLPRIVYFAPRRYSILSSDPSTSIEIIVPEGIELRFAPNALLNPAPGVTLVIRGSIRAGAYQIFGRLQADVDGSLSPIVRGYLSRQTAPRGLIRIESLEVPEILPEWWGAIYTPTDSNVDSSDALQACIHAAVRDRVRDGRPLPPLPIALRSQYRTQRKLRVEAMSGRTAALWLKGADPITHGGLQGASIAREINHVLLREMPGVLGANPSLRPELAIDRDCLLEVGPRVSVNIQDVSFRVVGVGLLATGGYDPGLPDDVAVGVKVLRDTDHRPRTFYFERCGMSGSREACLSVEPAPLSAGPIRQRFVQCTFNTQAIDLEAAAAPTDGVSIRTQNAVRLQLLEADSVSFSECWFRGIKQTVGIPRAGEPVPLFFRAGIEVLGGAVMVRASTFHFGDGPRPSRPRDELGNEPGFAADGQDIWLRAMRRVRSTQLTVLHVESQSWWFLGAEPAAPGDGMAATLIAFSGGNVQWPDAPFHEYLRATRRARPGIAFTNDHPDPPPVIWPGGDSRLITVGCRFREYAALARDAKIFDVGSTFEYRARGAGLPVWRPLSAVRRPPKYLLVPTTASDSVRIRCLPVLVRLG